MSTHVTPVRSLPAHAIHPVWSPDGKTLAFESDLSGNWDIWIMDHDGRNEQRVARGSLGAKAFPYDVDRDVFDGLSFLYLSWSPDSEKLAFTRVNGEGKGEIALLKVGGEK